MTESEILAEVKKAIDLFLNKTYEVEDLYGHLLQVIRENSDTGEKHKANLERLIYKVEEMREAQRLYHAGHRQKLGECKQLESEMDKKTMNMQTLGYSITRFKQAKPEQKRIF